MYPIEMWKVLKAKRPSEKGYSDSTILSAGL